MHRGYNDGQVLLRHVDVGEPKQPALPEVELVGQMAHPSSQVALEIPKEVGELSAVCDGQQEGGVVHWRSHVDEPAGDLARQGRAAAGAFAEVGSLLRGPAVPSVCRGSETTRVGFFSLFFATVKRNQSHGEISHRQENKGKTGVHALCLHT